MIKVIIAEVVTGPAQKELIQQRMDELDQLVHTYGGDLSVVQMVQQRAKPDYKTYMGSGKLEETIQVMKELGARILIFGNILKPAQIYAINEILKDASKDDGYAEPMQARDRVDLILKIFDRHANSTEARLQIELASIKHMGPRIYDMSMELGKQGSGTGSKGSGETNTETMSRHLGLRKKQIQKQLAKYAQVREVHRQSRQKKYLPTVGLVGYTNAGKSSLMNSLTNKGVLVEDKLFATLGTDVGKLYIPNMQGGKGTEILINDTIGFIRDLPPGLIEAFKSTLEDSIEADVLLHTIDAHDPLWDDKVRIVDEILDDIGAEQERVYVLNKIDLLDEQGIRKKEEGDAASRHSEGTKGNEVIEESRDAVIGSHQTLEQKKQWLESYCEEYGYDAPTIITVSAHTGEGMDELKELMAERVKWK